MKTSSTHTKKIMQVKLRALSLPLSKCWWFPLTDKFLITSYYRRKGLEEDDFFSQEFTRTDPCDSLIYWKYILSPWGRCVVYPVGVQLRLFPFIEFWLRKGILDFKNLYIWSTFFCFKCFTVHFHESRRALRRVLRRALRSQSIKRVL